jgi:hypothetical protein
MHKSLCSALPSLRPISPASTVETPRGAFPKAIAASNPRFSSDFEVNRSLFGQDVKALQPKSTKKPKLLPVAAAPKPVGPAPVDQNLSQVQALIDRIPTGAEPVELEDVFPLSPILDRILCLVGQWKTEFLIANLQHPIILELHQRLFALIDIDDFLLRTIVCRILLYFAADSESPLLLPIARIFYKLSCDPANDLFFVEESLENVLISLFRVSQPEGRVFTAGTIRNVAACEAMREKLSNSDFLNLVMETFTSETDSAVKLQLLGAIRHLCKNEEFKERLIHSQILSTLAVNRELFPDVMRIVAVIPEISVAEKLRLIEIVGSADLTEPQNKRTAIRALTVLTVGTDGNIPCAQLLLGLIQSCLSDLDLLIALLPFAEKAVDAPAVAELFQADDVVFDILRSQEYDTSICIAAYAIVKKLKGEKARSSIAEFSFLDEIRTQLGQPV